MNEKLHTAATAAGFVVGSLLIVGGVALASFPQLGGDPKSAFEYGALFLAGSGLITVVPKVG